MLKEPGSDNFELIRKIQNGDSEALEELVEQNSGLVKKIALRFTGRGTEYEDLTQIGMMGMIKAARSFDFNFGTAFSTYAVPLIMGEIRRFLRDDGLIKVGRSTKQKGMLIMREREKFLGSCEREPRVSELAELTGFSSEEVVECMGAVSNIVSLSEPVGDDGELTLESTISDDSCTIDGITDRMALNEAIRKLPSLWRNIVYLRYYKELSQVETGKKLGLTQVKVSREEQKILTCLRKELG